MSEVKIDVVDESACVGCKMSIAIEVHKCPSCGEHNYRLPFDVFFSHLDQMNILDARHGGLVLGRTGAEDDIPMFYYDGGGIFKIGGLMQGGEYILSQAATAMHGDELERINAEIGTPDELSLQIGSFTSVINTNLLPPSGGLWIRRRQFIVNRYATAKYLDLIESMNADGRSDEPPPWINNETASRLDVDDFAI